ncbi:hypothetical protein SLI_2322 [Streptomyces lividans 1326]|uniref:Uncharacterized protein n=1 Tax=Streptomyces lividans 1326 TaxID=1200984 RepID=A0A7U9DN38_STRLI|nr:hypothetical protein SLI_2322 [Streptomyces lividans 1326]
MRRHRVNPSPGRPRVRLRPCSAVVLARRTRCIRPVVTSDRCERLHRRPPSTVVVSSTSTVPQATLRQLSLRGHPFLPDIHHLAI